MPLRTLPLPLAPSPMPRGGTGQAQGADPLPAARPSPFLGRMQDPAGLIWANGGTDRETLKKAVARGYEAVADRLMLERRGQDAITQ